MGLFNPVMGYVAAGALALGLATGWKVKDWQCDAAYSKALEKADKQRHEMQGKIDAVSTLYQTQRDQADVVVAGTTREIREIYKTLPAVPADCAADYRIVGLLEGGINRANAAASGESGK